MVLILTMCETIAETETPTLTKLLSQKINSIYSLFPLLLCNMTKSNLDRKRYPLATTNNLNMVRIATVLFFISFIAASYYSHSPQLKQCLADKTISNDYCFKKF